MKRMEITNEYDRNRSKYINRINANRINWPVKRKKNEKNANICRILAVHISTCKD